MKKLLKVMLSLGAVALVASCSGSGKKAQNAQEAPASPKVDASKAAIENIMTRTSIRSYTEEPVSDADIETMLRAAMAAPTAMNAQPWQFVVVKDAEKRAKLESEVHVRNASKAPLVIVPCSDPAKIKEGMPEFWVEDVSAATENLLLAAHALGLGAVWCGAYPGMDRVVPARKVLSLPENVNPVAFIVIGHPAESPAPKDKWNPAAVHVDSWDGAYKK